MVSGSKGDSRIKKSKQQSLAFAKDPKQAALAVGVVVLFIIAMIHAIIQISSQQSPSTAGDMNTQTTTAQQGVDASNTANTANPAPLQGQTPPVPTDANANMSQDANNIYSQTVDMQNSQPQSSVMPSQAGGVDILPQKRGKMVSVVVGDSGRVNPFLPPGETFTGYAPKVVKRSAKVVPMMKLKPKPKLPTFPYLTAPPHNLQSGSEAGKVMTTVVSGILYDKYSPSAILNIEGTDYLFKKGDVVNRYKVLSITKTQVIVQLGHNIYQAGVGQLLSPSEFKNDTIANLNKKFGGNNNNVVSIKVRKKVK